jgi:hypothetical protein
MWFVPKTPGENSFMFGSALGLTSAGCSAFPDSCMALFWGLDVLTAFLLRCCRTRSFRLRAGMLSHGLLLCGHFAYYTALKLATDSIAQSLRQQRRHGVTYLTPLLLHIPR